MATRGELEKMLIIAYNDPAYDDSHEVPDGRFTAMMNPESYTLDYKVTFNQRQGSGTSGTQQRFFAKLPEDMQFEFLFDNTGLIDGVPLEDGVNEKIENFKKLLIENDPDSHEPRHF